METSIGINFSVKRFTSSKDKDFLKALMIYNDTIPVDTKTSTSEIIYFADHATDQPKREMYFFGLYADGDVVGFVEAGYLLTTKTIIIDYIVLKDSFRLNSIFYPLFSLIQRYFSEHMVDYDYIATEVSTKCPEQSVDTESFFGSIIFLVGLQRDSVYRADLKMVFFSYHAKWGVQYAGSTVHPDSVQSIWLSKHRHHR